MSGSCLPKLPRTVPISWSDKRHHVSAEAQAGDPPVSAGPPARFRTASRLPLVRVGPIIGIIGRIGLASVCFADGFVLAFPNRVPHGLTDELSAAA
jgi:hypothetical protein